MYGRQTRIKGGFENEPEVAAIRSVIIDDGIKAKPVTDSKRNDDNNGS